MSLSLAIAIIVLCDLALLAGLSYVMSRAKLLTPHVPGNGARTPQHAAARTARPTRRAAHVRGGTVIGVEG